MTPVGEPVVEQSSISAALTAVLAGSARVPVLVEGAACSVAASQERSVPVAGVAVTAAGSVSLS